MSSRDLAKILKAVEAVKQDYICCVCSEFCKNPVTLSKCFHIICEEHFSELKFCPNCNTNLDDCTTYFDERLVNCVQSAKELDNFFETLRNKNDNHSASTSNKRDVTTKSKEITRKVKAEYNKMDSAADKTNQMNAEPTKSSANLSLISCNSKFNRTAEKRNTKGETILHIACRLGKIDKVSELLKQGVNTNTKDNAGWTPLHEAVQNGNVELVSLLLQHNTLIDVPGQSNETPLHEAVRYNYKEIAEVLVRNGADIHARNCKGENPLQLASSEMKNILITASNQIIQTQTININLISALYSELDLDNIRVYCISHDRTVHNKLKMLVKTHSNMRIEAKLSNLVTHLIVDADENGVCQSSLDILQGVVNSVWILTSQWITKSNEDRIEPFEKHEVTGIGMETYQGPRNSRYNRYRQLPGIFNGCHFYLHNFQTKYEISKAMVLTKQFLTKLISDAGGVVLRRVPNPESIPEQEKLVPYHAQKGGTLVNCSHYIIFHDEFKPEYKMHHIKVLPIGWLIGCLEKYELYDPW